MGKVIDYVRNVDKDTMFRRLVEVVESHQLRIEMLTQRIEKLEKEKKNDNV